MKSLRQQLLESIAQQEENELIEEMARALLLEDVGHWSSFERDGMTAQAYTDANWRLLTPKARAALSVLKGKL